METGGDEWIPLFKDLTERLLELDKFLALQQLIYVPPKTADKQRKVGRWMRSGVQTRGKSLSGRTGTNSFILLFTRAVIQQ